MEQQILPQVNAMEDLGQGPDLDKCEAFKEEIDLIQNQQLRTLAQRLIMKLPDYFFEVPASSTGKYHPSYSLGLGGLLRHTKAAVRIAAELLRLEMYSSLKPAQDYIIIALMLHDGWKHGKYNNDGTFSQYTKSNHPTICAEWLTSDCIGLIDESILNYIASLVVTHMGQWNMDYQTGACFAPKPATQEQCFVHLCDYLASRKCLEMNFDIKFEGWNS